MSTAPCLSIIIPTHNLEIYIEETIQSILHQNHILNFEIIAVDNLSTDRTLEILHSFRSQDKRIAILENKNKKGAASTRNIGIQHCTGKWVTFLDGDDVWHPDTFKEFSSALHNHPETRLIACDFNLWQDDKKTPKTSIDHHYKKHFHVAYEQNAPSTINNLANVFLKDSILTRTGALFIERNTLLNAGPFDETLHICEDSLMWLNLARITDSMVIIPKQLLDYRIRQGSLTNQGTTNSDWHYKLYLKVLKMPEFKQYKNHIRSAIAKHAANKTNFYRQHKNHTLALISALQWTFHNPGNTRAWKCLLAALIAR